MAERSIIDQLDDAVAALAEGRQLDTTNFDPKLAVLAAVAQDIIGLPREAFKAELKQQLIRVVRNSKSKQTRRRRSQMKLVTSKSHR
jgi:hypothetical protein